jgi:hypothetical protein
MLAIPFYYKPYVVNYLEKRGLWATESNYIKKLYEDNVNEAILSQIKQLCHEESERLATINSIYAQNKASHTEHTASCCRIDVIFQSKNRSKDGNKNNDLNDFLNSISDINSSIKKLHLGKGEEKKNQSANENVEIEFMGDYREHIEAHKPLRSPYLFEEEIGEFKGDYFGNPFRRSTLDLSQANINLDNISITDGEKIILEEELSIMGDKKSKKPSTNSFEDNPSENTMDVDDISETTSINSSNIVIESNSPIQLSIIEDNLTEEFREMFNKDLPEQIHLHSGLKITIPMKVDMKDLYDFKFTESLKESKIKSFI